MDWNSAVSKGCFRYIVPFTFDNSFEEAVTLTEKQMDPEGSKKHAWIRRIPAEDKRESDLYDYIRCEARFDDAAGDLPDEKIGCEWLYRLFQEPWRIKRDLQLFSFVIMVLRERFNIFPWKDPEEKR
jgi:hypothetical protein